MSSEVEITPDILRQARDLRRRGTPMHVIANMFYVDHEKLAQALAAPKKHGNASSAAEECGT